MRRLCISGLGISGGVRAHLAGDVRVNDLDHFALAFEETHMRHPGARGRRVSHDGSANDLDGGVQLHRDLEGVTGAELVGTVEFQAAVGEVGDDHLVGPSRAAPNGSA